MKKTNTTNRLFPPRAIGQWLLGAWLLIAANSLLAATTIYSIRVDGLACPYCAYGIEKKFNRIDGVRFLDMDLERGVVTVESQGIKLDDNQLEQLFEDSGFTYRGKSETVKTP